MYRTWRKNALDVETWRCRTDDRCLATLKIKDGKIVAEPTCQHRHDSLPIKADFLNGYSEMKQQIKLPGARPKRVMDDIYSPMDQYTVAQGPKQTSIVRVLNKQKQNREPIPDQRTFEVPQRFLDFLVYDSGEDDEERILAFGWQELVWELEDATTIFGDGRRSSKQFLSNLFFTRPNWRKIPSPGIFSSS